MIVKTEILEKIRARLNSLVGNYFTVRFDSDSEQGRALDISVREALAGVREAMPLSDEEEEMVQKVESEKLVDEDHARKVIARLLGVIRTREPKRVLFKSPGQVMHEGFHTSLHAKGQSKYGKGCWHQMSPERQQAWEDAAVAYADSVALGKTKPVTPFRTPFRPFRSL